MGDFEPTYRLLVTSFTDFLTVATHIILYERQIYPQTSFLSARKYNFTVRQNRHPKVCEWINDAIAAVEAELLKGTVAQVAVMIYDKRNCALERFVFDVSRFPTLPAKDLDTPLERISPDGEKVSILPQVDMEEQFRATLSRIAGCNSMLKPLPSGCTFTIVIHLKEDGAAPVGHPQPWMPVEPQDSRSSKREPSVKPLRAVSAGDMILETWIEQSAPNDGI